MWLMFREAVSHYGDRATHQQIADYIHKKWDHIGPSQDSGTIKPVPPGTIYAKFRILCVNRPQRLKYWENLKPRLTNTGNNNDLLFCVNESEVELYEVEKHGIWEIYELEADIMGVRKTG
jgi:hypothetical protein